jgi:adenine/guanine/hypoxanthine permease
MNILERLFLLKAHGVTAKTEVIAGISTFLTMAYIILVNPTILHQAGMPIGATFVATCVVTALACFLTGVLSNYPIAMAPAMALNAYFTYVVVQGLGYTWQTALGAVFLSGLAFFVIAATPLRRWLIDAIPETMNMAIAAGLGLFIAMLGLKGGGLIQSNPHTLLAIGNLHKLSAVLFFSGFCLIVVLDYFEVKAAIIIGILAITLAGILCGINHFHGIVNLPPSVAPTFAQLNFHSLFSHTGFSVVFAFFLVSLFDTTGTFVGILHQAGLFRTAKNSKQLARGLLSSSIASMAAGVMGSSSISPYCESAAGVKAGGRTGLTSVVVAALFLVSLFFSPLAQTIPNYAASAALLFVGCLMVKSFTHFNWEDMTDTIPSVVTALMIPFSFSIADGIGFGFISYVIIKLFTGKIRQVHPMLIIWAFVFLIYFWVV